MFLCLNCRGLGHRSDKCKSVSDMNDEVSWFTSRASRKLYRVLDLQSPKILCRRCKGLDLVAWMKGKPPIASVDDIDEHSLSDREVFISLGPVSSVTFDNTCPLCCCLFKLTPNLGINVEGQQLYLARIWTLLRLERRIDMNLSAEKSSSVCVTAFLWPSETTLSIKQLCTERGEAMCLADAGTDPPALLAKAVDERLVDIEQVLGWIQTCAKLHPHTCLPKVSAKLQNALLIDVNTRKVVPFPREPCDYLALSYVWGKHILDYGRSTKANGELGKLPKTIEDAILLVQKLQKRFLWVDSICIDQTNSLEKAAQIAQMSDIYQGAWMTIVALYGSSASSGLPRVRLSKSRNQWQIDCMVDGHRILGYGPTLTAMILDLPWGGRAWTLQEALLSPRNLFLSSHQAYFECNAMQCAESIDMSNSKLHQTMRDDKFQDQEDLVKMVGIGELRGPSAFSSRMVTDRLYEYQELTRLYSYRRLSFQNDALNAFDGILQAMSRTIFPEGFFWGLPIAHLDQALLWELENVSAKKHDDFPSWSWAHCAATMFGDIVWHCSSSQKDAIYASHCVDITITANVDGLPKVLFERSDWTRENLPATDLDPIALVKQSAPWTLSERAQRCPCELSPSSCESMTAKYQHLECCHMRNPRSISVLGVVINLIPHEKFLKDNRIVDESFVRDLVPEALPEDAAAAVHEEEHIFGRNLKWCHIDSHGLAIEMNTRANYSTDQNWACVQMLVLSRRYAGEYLIFDCLSLRRKDKLSDQLAYIRGNVIRLVIRRDRVEDLSALDMTQRRIYLI